MSSVCNRCALRLQRAAARSEASATPSRAFTTSAARRKDHHVPAFSTSDPELSHTLNEFRDKHFIPSLLSKPQQRLIFGDKNRKTLDENPQSVSLGGEEIDLHWINRRTEIPNRSKLLHTAIDQISASSSKETWDNLPSLLIGLKQCHSTPKPKVLEKIVRRAIQAGRMGVLIRCLQQSEKTGLSLTQPEVLRHVVQGLHEEAQKAGWSEAATSKALRHANTVAALLESSNHGSGKFLKKGDARRKPEVVAVFLELAAVFSYKHQGGEDKDGKVKAYTERLVACLEAESRKLQPASKAPPAVGPVWEMLYGVPIWHGLSVARKVLGEREMPRRDLCARVEGDYKAGLQNLAQAVEGRGAEEGSYGSQALRYWRECVRD